MKTQVCAVLQHQRGHRVPEQVRTSAFADVRCQQIIVHHAAEMIAAECITVLGEEQRHVVRFDCKLRPDLAEIFVDPLGGALTDSAPRGLSCLCPGG